MRLCKLISCLFLLNTFIIAPVFMTFAQEKMVMMVEQYLKLKIHAESNGDIKLVSFSITNGNDIDISGSRRYQIEFCLVIEMTTDVEKVSEDKLSKSDWYWKNYYAGEYYYDPYMNNLKSYPKGSQVEVTGEIFLDKSENGWLIRNNYINKKSRDIFMAPEEKTIIRYDGMYVGKEEGAINTFYMRFYPDGEVVSINTIENIKASQLGKKSQHPSAFFIDGKKITFNFVHQDKVDTTYGIIKGNTIITQWNKIKHVFVAGVD